MPDRGLKALILQQHGVASFFQSHIIIVGHGIIAVNRKAFGKEPFLRDESR